MIRNKKVQRTIRWISSSINAAAYVSPQFAGRMAFDVFCRPIGGGINEKNKSFLATAQRHTLKAHGYDVRVYEWPGNGPTVLLAHGWASNSGRWRYWLPALQEAGFRVLALDAPAHGESGSKRFHMLHYAGFIKSVLDHFTVDMAVGHSVGAASLILQQCYTNPPAAIKKLVLMAPPSELKSMTRDYFKIMQYNSRTKKGYEKFFKQKFGFAVNDFSIAGLAHAFPYPALVIHDPDDTVTVFDEGRLIAQALPMGRFMATKNKDHHLYGPDVIEAAVAFLLENR
jgi:pimeloyl-ACP methyl ester carboxylesterase